MSDTIEQVRARARQHQEELTERLYASAPELAKRWGISPQLVRDIPASELPFKEFGGGRLRRRRRYRWEDVEAFEARDSRATAAPAAPVAEAPPR